MVQEEEYKTEAELLAEWLKTQDDLPNHMEHVLLRRYVHSVHGDLEKAKNLIIIGLKYRTKYENIFHKRDPLSKESQLAFQTCDMIPLPISTEKNYKILLYRLADFDVSKYDFTEAVKGFFMMSDTRLITPDPCSKGITDGEIPIFDMNGVTLRHMTKLVLSSVRIYMKYIQEAHPVRLKQIHIINCSSFLDRFMAIIKPFIKGEVFKLMHFHQPNTTTLYEFVPLELLPNDYGGKAGFCADLKKGWLKEIESKRNYLTDLDNWRIKTKNTNDKGKGNEIETQLGSLSID